MGSYRTNHLPESKLVKPLMAVGTTAAVSQLLVMIQSLLLARWVGPAQNAIVLASLSLAALAFILVNWGFDQWMLQKTSQSAASGAKNLKTVLKIKFGLGLVIGVILALAFPVIKPDVYPLLILILAITDTLTDSLSNSYYTYLLATGQFKRSSLVLIIGRTLRVLGTLVLILLKVDKLVYFLGLRLLTDVLILGYLYAPLKPTLSSTETDDSSRVRQGAWPFGLAEVLNHAYDRSDLTLLALLTKVPQEISFYGTAMNIILAGSAVLQTLQNILVPYIIKKDSVVPADSRSHYRQSLTMIFGAGILGMLFLMLYGRQIIDLVLGVDYVESGRLVTLASPLLALRSVNIAFSSFLIARLQEKRKILPLGLVTVLKTILVLAAYPTFGLEGMIKSYITCEALLLLFYGLQLVLYRNSERVTSTERIE